MQNKFLYHMRRVKEVQKSVAAALERGAWRRGDHVAIEEGYTGLAENPECGAIVFGIGGGTGPLGARTIMDDYTKAGRQIIFIDKGYTRKNTFRVAVNGFHPTQYLMKLNCLNGRFDAANLIVKPYPKTPRGDYILFDGASQKYCNFMKLGDQLDWGISVLKTIRAHSDRNIAYRPRPTHNRVDEDIILERLCQEKLTNVRLDVGPVAESIEDAYTVVSHGGNIGWEAALAGKPNFIIHDSIARPVAETEWSRLDKALVPTEELRRRWMYNVMHCQWTINEFADGTAWEHIQVQLKMSRGILPWTGIGI
jgi:hypothetical protein